MAEYQPNSHRSKQLPAESSEEKRVKKVVKGNVKTRKNSGRKLANIFISEDAANVKSYVFMDVLVPAIKKAVSDIVRDGIDMILYGESGGSHRRERSSDRESYRRYYEDRDRRNRRDDDRYRSSGRFEYDDLEFDSRGDAELVRDEMLDTIDRYGMVTVADLYDMAGKTAPHTAHRYGWVGIRYIDIKRVRDGYILQLPKPMPID